MVSAAEARALLRFELNQRREEGCEVSGLARRIARLARAGKSVEAILALYDELMSLRPAARMARKEPTDLARIRKLRPAGPRRIRHRSSDARLRDRLRGAMLGRCAGCQLGKPVENWEHDRILGALKKDGSYPLRNYIRRSVLLADDPKRAETPWVRETIECMDRDDDIDYTILGIHYLKQYGRGFTTRNVADEWLNRLPYCMTYTAERAAYRNLVAGVPLEKVATTYNPFREWIGAQIRADGFGYCAAGMPELAAELAHRDAVLSHVKNGVYGEMLFAATIAAALVTDDLREAIEIGLSEIPAACRLAEAVRQTVRWCEANGDDWLATLKQVQAAYGHYDGVHTINNAAVVILSLLHGNCDFERTICIAVMCGWDTDCNGATAGSVVGAILGQKRLPRKWIAPLKNRLRSFVIGYDNVAITDVADQAYELHRGLRRSHS
jgi:ADP-ribosylglycohydrolase